MPARPGLRYLNFWRGLGVMFVLVALALSLMPYQFRSPITYIDKIYHTLTYAGLMAWFTQVYARRWHLGLAVLLVAFGVVVELLQLLTGYRSAEWQDALANAGGVLIGWGLYLTPLGGLLLAIEGLLGRVRKLPDK